MTLLSRSTTRIVAVGAAAILLAWSPSPTLRMPAVRLAACVGAPTLTAIAPTSGRVYGGTSVTVTGCGFSGATAVKFGIWEAYSFSVDSDTQITATSPGQAGGTVDVTVTTPSGTSATSPADQFSYYGPCRNVQASLAPPTPQTVGALVTVAAQAPNCRNPLFRFEMLPPGSQIWQVTQDYSTNASYNWDTASLPAGQYIWVVKARDASALSGYDGYAMAFYDLNQPAAITPCADVNSSSAPASPQQAGTPVTVTDVPSGCANPRHQFEFLAAGSQTWVVVQTYSTSDTYNWDTSSLPAGVQKLIVKVRDATSEGSTGVGNPNGSWDAYTVVSFTITDGSAPCAGVTASAAPVSPQNMGTAVRIAGSATGCPTGARYQFEMLTPASQVWQVVQAYSTNASFNWSTTRHVPGAYRFIIKAKDKAFPGAAGMGNPNGSWDVYTALVYTLSSTACTGVSASSSPSSTVSEGTLVIITANATGCPNPEYQFELNEMTNWSVDQTYGPEKAMYWVTRAPSGTYEFIIKARDSNSPGLSGTGNDNWSWDAYVKITATIT